MLRIILYSIAMVDYDQDNSKVCKSILKTRDGISRLALYQKSVGRFPDASGAFRYPMYGHGELSQAFCHRAAVKGCLQVLRRPVIDCSAYGQDSLKGDKRKVARGICIQQEP